MKDPRIESLAKLLLTHSLQIKSGEQFEINSGILAKPLIKALMKEASKLGAVPRVKLEDDELTRLSFSYIDSENLEASNSVIDKELAYELERWEHLSAHIDIGVDENDAEMSSVDAKVLSHYRTHMKKLRDIRINEKRWVYLHWPTMADAQKASLCYDDLFELFLSSALLDYKKMHNDVLPLVSLMERTKHVRILGVGTDISFSIEGMNVVPCIGRRNIPDGEVYTAPNKLSVNGHIQYNTCANMFGKNYNNPRLVVKDGRIVEAYCDNATKGFNDLLDMDEGARFFGEFALGINNALKTPIGNTLYDEKIGGSFHLTPGNAYKSAFNTNESALHLDLVCLQAKPHNGEIWFDGECIRKDGLFLPQELLSLNPDT